MTTTINASTTAGLVQTADTSGVLALQTAGTTAISIDASQNVNFPVSGQRITGDFSSATFGNRVAFQTSTANSATTVNAIPSGTGTVAQFMTHNAADPSNASRSGVNCSGTLATFFSDQTGTGTYLPMVFNTGGTESLRLSATTKAVILAGGSTSANGTGITFPATQSASTDANTLDDYEEGTWSPVPTPNAGSITSYTVANTSYTKIGRLVQATARVTITNIGTASQYLVISGLPFTAGSTFQLPNMIREGGLTGNIYQGYVDGGGTSVTVQTLTGGYPTYSNNMSLSMNIIYFV